MASRLLLRVLAHASGLRDESRSLSSKLQDNEDLQVPANACQLPHLQHTHQAGASQGGLSKDFDPNAGRRRRTQRRSRCRRCWTVSCGRWSLRGGGWWRTPPAAAACTCPAPSTRCTTATGQRQAVGDHETSLLCSMDLVTDSLYITALQYSTCHWIFISIPKARPLVNRQLMAAACKAAGGLPGCYELTVGHPDKGRLPLAEVQRRLQPFLDDGTPIIVTQVGRPSEWHVNTQ